MNYRKQLFIANLSLLSFLGIVLAFIGQGASATDNYTAGRNYSATIIKIIENDTADLAINGKQEHARLICTNTVASSEKPFYKQAKDYLAQLITVSSNLKVLVSPQLRDRTVSKRLFAEIFTQLAVQPVNQMMVI